MTASRRTTPRSVVAIGLLTAATVLTGCGSAAEPSPPTGVDGLTIPTPDPDPDDFVAEVDNRWLPMESGATWTYETLPGEPGGGEVRVVAEAGGVHGGITTTALIRTVLDQRGRERSSTTDHYAQDTDGNVWWFGRDETWFAEPGLAMPAQPRRGDGFRVALAPGLDVRAEVTETDAELDTALGELDGIVVLAVTASDGSATQLYAPGIGLVRNATAGLVAFDEPR
ncbi:hypothetical protein FXB39_05845 [Nocardioides sp. BGMRC 2183]|nr:hypothetical protein FXB39_05845 [Nocardioides sp. BGMRC 2183]